MSIAILANGESEGDETEFHQVFDKNAKLKQ
jgi:hypothetical protein